MIRIDHHRPGDPGYNLPPSNYWQASSLGQLAHFLGRNMEMGSQDNLILAAMDHCPAAAIRGECPGVSAEDVLERKVAEIAGGTRESPETVLARIDLFRQRLATAPMIGIALDSPSLADLRAWDTGAGYTLDYLAAQTAALAEGWGVLLLTHDQGDPRQKWTIAGHCTPHQIESFMKVWGPEHGLTGIYGVPSRGYAGGYLA